MAKFKAPKKSAISKATGINTNDLYSMQHQLQESARKDRNKKVQKV